MARRSRRFSTFSLSFLDIMSCGFGAVALIFLIIKHDVDTRAENLYPDLQAETSLLEQEVLSGERQRVLAKNTLSEVDQRLAQAQGLARAINEDIKSVKASVNQLLNNNEDDAVTSLQQQLKQLESDKEKLEQDLEKQGDNVRRFIGQGNRQYLTGLKLGGAYVLILIDSSASMLDDTLINIIRRRNMDDDTKRASKKWQQSLAIVEWLIAQLPERSRYQIYQFNTEVQSPLSGTEQEWLNVSDKAQLERGIDNLHQVIPEKGTSLHTTFSAISQLDPLPDNIFLITDGLPTQAAKKPNKSTITGPDRLKLFRKAVDLLPKGVPVNTILLPMEGDPFAAASFWQLAQTTQGSFLTPSADWP